ncbi:MAG: pyruvate kinase [Phycisphaerales bacterium]|nr:pyruvate kinase [Phycisphaerales bacterium]
MAQARRATSIIATVGPAVESDDKLDRLIAAGASVLRINASHGDRAAHDAWITRIRDAEARAGRPVGILMDLPGPKLRLTGLDGAPRTLDVGDTITLGDDTNAVDLQVTIPGLLTCLSPGHRVLIDDGAVRLLVEDVDDGQATCRVMTAGIVSQGKGVNLPDSDPPLQVPTDTDFDMARWAISRGADFLAMSFVGNADQLRALRGVFPAGEGQPVLIAKIERPVALDHLEAIVREADAVMVARGDLGVEMEIATVPVAQRQILATTRRLGRPCIVATQMLQSMIEVPSPTRAEAGDVSTAIRDGADAVMLSGETSIGDWPDLAVSTMARIAAVTEANTPPEDDFPPDEGLDPEEAALCEATWSTLTRVGADALLCRSRHGIWGMRMSRARLGLPILVVTDRAPAARRMTLLRGVLPILVDELPERPKRFMGLTADALRTALGSTDRATIVAFRATDADTDEPTVHLSVRKLEA